MKLQKQLEAAAQLPTKQTGCLSQKGLPECLLGVQAGKAKKQLRHECSVHQYGSLGQKARQEANVSFNKIYQSIIYKCTLLEIVKSMFLICNPWWNWSPD